MAFVPIGLTFTEFWIDCAICPVEELAESMLRLVNVPTKWGRIVIVSAAEPFERIFPKLATTTFGAGWLISAGTLDVTLRTKTLVCSVLVKTTCGAVPAPWLVIES